MSDLKYPPMLRSIFAWRLLRNVWTRIKERVDNSDKANYD